MTIVALGNPSSLGVSTFTIEAWFRRDGAGDGATTGGGGLTSAIPLVTKGAAQAETPANLNMNWYLGIDESTGALVADFEDTIDGTNHPVSGTTAVPMGVWTHAAATYDGQTWNLYLNGELDQSLTLASPFVPETTSIQPGAIGTSLESDLDRRGHFEGAIDEARVWNVARTQPEILADMNSELTTGTGLVARWGLNEGTGLTTADSVGSADGTLTNGPTWVNGFNYVEPPPTPGPVLCGLQWSRHVDPDS